MSKHQKFQPFPSLATLWGVGFLRPAPGTWGSLVALPLAWGLHMIGGIWLLLIAIICITGAAWPAVRGYCKRTGRNDPPEVVIDELVGQLIALLPVSAGATFATVSILALYPGWIMAFCLFRLLDILKPGPIGKADKRGGTTGVMLDDIIAGALTALGVAITGAIAHLL